MALSVADIVKMFLCWLGGTPLRAHPTVYVRPSLPIFRVDYIPTYNMTILNTCIYTRNTHAEAAAIFTYRHLPPNTRFTPPQQYIWISYTICDAHPTFLPGTDRMCVLVIVVYCTNVRNMKTLARLSVVDARFLIYIYIYVVFSSVSSSVLLSTQRFSFK